MPVKLSIIELGMMTSSELCDYIISVIQTPICKDKEYCKRLLEIWKLK